MLTPELLHLSSDSQFAELRIVPQSHGPITEEAVRQLLKLPEFAALLPLEQALKTAVKDVNNLSGKDEGSHELFFRIAERRDGQVTLETTKDKMHASMTLVAPWGGKAVTLPEVLQQLKQQNICMGLSKQKIEALLHAADKLQPGERVEGIIAVGKSAMNGTHAKLERKVPLARERLLQPQEREDGTVDMRNLGSVVMVRPKDLLMVKTPATDGTNGYNVNGEVIPAKAGKDIELKAGAGTEISPTNPNMLLAATAGQPVEFRGGMQVDDVLQIKDVDVGYGNVDFKGSVLISGDVCEGMRVRSSGDITVMGFVESAYLEADGDITVSKGVLGRQLGGNDVSTHLHAKGQISAQFVQYSHLECTGDVLITKQLLHSHTMTDTKLMVSDSSGRRGDLVGGWVKAEQGIQAVTIGATADTKTELYCAMRLDELKLKLKELDESIRQLVVAKLDMESRLRKLPPKAEWQQDAVMVEQVKMMLEQKHTIETELKREETEAELMRADSDSYYHRNHIEVKRHMYANVEIHIGGTQHKTQREHGPCIVENQGAEITFDYSNRN
ncbi:DUF342 domain-containing protein [Shewanella dokdonensis]|uniref:DUF342 domain-containing protein n=1 Tax=Shewanella dokdonensis TaxID=712036 RepID=A0ABX8DD64_9GAMM|nr:FapA family protein [Shewanella dokdonensis]MCL1074650.1 FapA family protein [Shewanella dokdonensis]QVK22355.1 DUF342 domain-containing protein [Shewanella dokdonensis]